MKPTPCKLALAMSLAGLGASLGSAAHAATSNDAAAASHPAVAAAVGLPLPVVGERSGSLPPLRVNGFPLALDGPLDGAFATADKAAPVAAASRRIACTSAMRGRPLTVAPPRSLWGARRGAARAPAMPGEPLAEATDAAGAAHCGTAPEPGDPTRHRLVDGVGGRPPKAPPRPAAKPWELAAALGDDPDGAVLSGHHADVAAAEPAASPGVPAPGTEVETVVVARVPTPAERVREELARHLRATDATRAAPPAEASLAAVDIHLDIRLDGPAGAAPATLRLEPVAQAAYDVDLLLDIEPEAMRVAAASPRALSPLGTTAATAARVDLELDLDLDFYLGSIASAGGDAGSPAGHGEARVGAARVLDLDLDLPDLGLGRADGGQLPARAATGAASPARQVRAAVAHADARLAGGGEADASCRAEDDRVAPPALPQPAAGLHDDATLHRLEALISEAVGAPCGLGSPRDELFVALPGVAASPTAVLRRPAAAGLPASVAPPAGALPETAASSTIPAPAGGDAPIVAGDASTASGADAPGEQRAVLGEALALSESRLGEVRGGFETGGGLQFSHFGIERAVYVNGQLVSTSSLLSIGEKSPQAGAAPVGGSTGPTLIQIGAGNTFMPVAMPSGAIGTVIQNTLDGQTIRTITSINATVNSLEIMKARSFESSMRGAIVDSLRR